MAELRYTDIQPGVFFKMNGEIYETIEATFSKKSRQKGGNQVRIKNSADGSVITKTLRTSDKMESVVIEKKDYTFIYARNDEAVIHPKGNPAERITIPTRSIPKHHLIPTGETLTALTEKDTILTASPRIKIDVTVTQAPPSIRGNTAQGGTKQVTTETGATITVPLFIETGDRITINTETEEYVERSKKQTTAEHKA